MVAQNLIDLADKLTGDEDRPRFFLALGRSLLAGTAEVIEQRSRFAACSPRVCLAIIMLTADSEDGQARITALREGLEKLGWTAHNGTWQCAPRTNSAVHTH